MIYGIRDGQRVVATPGAKAECPCCKSKLVAKCGRIVAWHWAHESVECDPWSEGESAWHLEWKSLVPPERREVVRGPHRADMVGPGGGVVELQHSAISVDEIEERERFYGKMVWVFDAQGFERNIDFREHEEFFSFRWRWPRKSILSAARPVFFDFGEGHLFEVRKHGEDAPLGGWGYHRSKAWFCQKFLGVTHDLNPTSDDFYDFVTKADCTFCGKVARWRDVDVEEYATKRSDGTPSTSYLYRCVSCKQAKTVA